MLRFNLPVQDLPEITAIRQTPQFQLTYLPYGVRFIPLNELADLALQLIQEDDGPITLTYEAAATFLQGFSTNEEN
jgi:hypothetical protein